MRAVLQRFSPAFIRLQRYGSKSEGLPRDVPERPKMILPRNERTVSSIVTQKSPGPKPGAKKDELLDNLDNGTGTNGVATLTDS